MFNGLFFGGCRADQPACFNVTFRVIDADDCPICGAVYRLNCGCGKFVNALSGKNGCVTFCVHCGTYELTQVADAFGYEPDPATHKVCVTKDGCIKIDGLPLRCFNSINERLNLPAPDQADPPEIDPIFTNSIMITGRGEPGCKVEVCFPNGCVCTTCVRRNETWSIDVPDNMELIAEREITAVQVCECKPRSAPATEPIQAAP